MFHYNLLYMAYRIVNHMVSPNRKQLPLLLRVKGKKKKKKESKANSGHSFFRIHEYAHNIYNNNHTVDDDKQKKLSITA